MKKLVYMAIAMVVLFAANSCKEKKNTPVISANDSVEVEEVNDSTIYGVCGEGTAMHSLELITDQGDTLHFLLNMDEEANVQGGLLEGDRLAVIAGKSIDGDKTAKTVINITTLQGEWTSIDKNFEIQEGGVVRSNVKAETNPWTLWKIVNGKLLLNKDTFKIDELGADSLYLENDKGIFVYKRQK